MRSLSLPLLLVLPLFPLTAGDDGPRHLDLEWAKGKAAVPDEGGDGYETYRARVAKARELQRRGFALYKQGNEREAVRVYEEALNYHATAALYYDYGNSLSNIPRLADALKAYTIALALGPREPHLVYYNMACAASRLRDATKGFAYLDKALEKGYSTIEYLGRDADLAFLRGTPRWAAWYAAVRAIDIAVVFRARYAGRWLTNTASNIRMLFRIQAGGKGTYVIDFIDGDRADKDRDSGKYPEMGVMAESGDCRLAGNRLLLDNQYSYMKFPRTLLVRPLDAATVEINGVVYGVGAVAKD